VGRKSKKKKKKKKEEDNYTAHTENCQTFALLDDVTILLWLQEVNTR
jgi:hypothetical protein